MCNSIIQSFNEFSSNYFRDMRQTVAVGVIKSTTPKDISGTTTKAAQKAQKKKWCIVLQELGDKKFANDLNTKKEQESHHSCLKNNLINAPESSTQSLFLYVIKLNFYFHRKEFRRIKGSINKSILFTIDKPWISWQLANSVNWHLL